MNTAFSSDIERGLLVAIEKNDLESVLLHLFAGADPMAVDPYEKWSPLHTAACMADSSVIWTLIQAGSNIESADDMGIRPVFKTLLTDNVDQLRCFIEAGADLKWLTRDGQTLLHKAIFLSAKKCAMVLVDEGLDLSLPNSRGTTSFELLDTEEIGPAIRSHMLRKSAWKALVDLDFQS